MESSEIKSLAEIIPLVTQTRATEPDGITSSSTQVDVTAELSALSVGKKFLVCSFDSYTGVAKNKVVIAAHKKPLPWMYIFGPTGSGKTHLAIAVIRYMLESGRMQADGKHRTIKFANVAELLFEIRHTYDSGRFGENEWSHMQKYNNADLLVLDDLGAERTSDWALDVIYRVIAYRDKNGLVTITTSNFDPAEIEKIHGAPVASRICQGEIIKIDAADYRKKRG
jgi:chromosomal replication initiation ATPase DnaA